jgi:hypothetical protein
MLVSTLRIHRRRNSAGAHHEHRAGSEDVVGGSDRAFGLTVGGILAAIAAGRWFLAGDLDRLSFLLLAVAGPLLIAGAVAPARLAPLNRVWTRLGLLMASVVSPVAAFAIYAVAIVPTAIALKIARRDPLRREFEPRASSYWIARRPPGPPPETMRDLF